jgi:polyribonucleotide nucleotidyltransferase
MDQKTFTLNLGDQSIIVETGKLAQQCNGSCVVRMGETILLATCTLSKDQREGIDFLPLMVNYQEKYYASGSIRGARYVRREARPPIDKIIMGRLIDRGIRPMLPKDLRRDIQLILTILSYDGQNAHDIVAANAASLAVAISDCPFAGPLGTVRVGMIGGEFVLNPNDEIRGKSDLDLVVTSSKENVVMLEVQANEIPEEKLLEAIDFGKKWGQKIVEFLTQIQQEIGKSKFVVAPIEYEQEVVQFVKDNFQDAISEAIYGINVKLERYARFSEIKKEAVVRVNEHFGNEEKGKQVSEIVDKLITEAVRKNILENERRIANRGLDEIRPVLCEIDLFKRLHGSALFQRGETQALTVTTLGAPGDKLIIDGMEGESKKSYFHHYNFPPFSVGEVSNRLGTGNRELGHGNLAEKALIPVLPNGEEFPYTIRTVTEILQSNGSSSMASTCGSTLSLMAAGVPIKAPVSGIAMGLMTDLETGVYKILTDLQDEEDFGGDMDFKVTGTSVGVTALQMDIKIKGLSDNILRETLTKAKVARLVILEKMLQVIPETRKELSMFAPRLYTLKIAVEQIKDVIGKGGETINKIIEQTGVTIDIEQDGRIVITSADSEMANKAVAWINKITERPEVGKIYEGPVTKLFDFGALVEIIPGIEGMVHISMMSEGRVSSVADFVKLGQRVKVKVMSIDPDGKMRLSMKDVK